MFCDVKIAPPSGEGGHPALRDPWEAALEAGPGAVLALLTATEGPAYRSLGAAMAIAPGGGFAGGITSGCVEADLLLRAEEVRASDEAQRLRYGAGSPFFDLKLPCGGAVEVLLFPLRDREALRALSRARAARRPMALRVSPDGALSLAPWRAAGFEGGDFLLGFRPPPRFFIFGAGPEAAVFADLVRSLDYGGVVFERPEDFDARDIDADCAAVLFYHDHDREPEILRRLLETPAFYIGAQGGQAAQNRRLAHLAEMGVAAADLARIRGPIGLAPSAREPRLLAVSVLAEILDLAAKRR